MAYQPPSDEPSYEDAFEGLKIGLQKRIDEAHRLDPTAPEIFRFYPINIGDFDQSSYLAILYAEVVQSPNDCAITYITVRWTYLFKNLKCRTKKDRLFTILTSPMITLPYN